MKYRLIFGPILIALLVVLIYTDDRLGRSAFAGDVPKFLEILGMVRYDGLIVTTVLVVLTALGTRELRNLLSSAGHAPLPRWPVLVNVALIVIPFIAANGPPFDTDALHATDHQYSFAALVIALLGTGFFVAARRKTEGAIAAVGTSLLIILYLGLLPQYLVRLRVFGGTSAAWLLLYFIVTVKICDIGAYFTGRFLGRHKLIEWLSPKKTIEGLLGGIAASVLFAVATVWLVQRYSDPSSPLHDLFAFSLARCAGFGALMGLIGQGGDLLESLFKRDAQVKDSARAIPSFGGVLDILDSLLPTAPVAYWMLLQ
ncbi:MAG: phosphatidate cytidylyltransferase [Phycisphaerales bacterium]|nr:phosphatidate cytidylyltransferase [Phycisphaerales bacterium]